MEETSTLRPFAFGELFSTTLALIRRTPAAVLIAFVILIGFGMLQTFGAMMALDMVVEAAHGGALLTGAAQDDAATAGGLLSQGGVLFIVVAMFNFLAAIFVMTMLVIAGWFAINGEVLRSGELVSMTFGRPFWIALIQTIMFITCVLLLLMFGAILRFPIADTSFGSYLKYVAGVAMLYLLIATMFRIHNIVAQDRGPWQGLIASIALAHSNLLRLSGVLILTAVIYGIFAWLVLMAMGESSTGGWAFDPEKGLSEAAARELRDSVTWGSSIVSSLLNSLFLVFISYLLTPLYVDLRARRGDFDPELEESYGG